MPENTNAVYLPNFLIAALSLLSSVTAACWLWGVFFWTLLAAPINKSRVSNLSYRATMSGQAD